MQPLVLLRLARAISVIATISIMGRITIITHTVARIAATISMMGRVTAITHTVAGISAISMIGRVAAITHTVARIATTISMMGRVTTITHTVAITTKDLSFHFISPLLNCFKNSVCVHIQRGIGICLIVNVFR
jgi:hypothetical protein